MPETNSVGKNRKTTGLIAAPYSPMDKNGNLTTEVIGDYASLLLRNGVKGAFICGSSGEGISLTLRERMKLAEAWTKQTAGRLKLIVHVGATNIRDSRDLAAHAASIGADAIAAVEPIYYLKPWMDDLVSFFREISSAAPGVPFYSYYIPALTGFNIDYIDFCSRAIRDIPDFAGIKYTNNNLVEYTQLIKAFGNEIDILFGSDELLINALSSGAAGAVGSTYNFMPSIYIDLIERFREGKMEEARELQIISQNIIGLMPRYHGSLVFGKAVMKIIGIDCGPVRLPLRNLTEPEISSLENDLNNTGFFKHCAK